MERISVWSVGGAAAVGTNVAAYSLPLVIIVVTNLERCTHYRIVSGRIYTAFTVRGNKLQRIYMPIALKELSRLNMLHFIFTQNVFM